MKFFYHFLLLSLAVFIAPYFIAGIAVDPLWTAFIVGALLLIINTVIKPVISILTLPINIITLGIFGIILNGVIFWFLGQYVSGFTVAGLMPAIWGALFVSVVNWLGGKLFKSDD